MTEEWRESMHRAHEAWQRNWSDEKLPAERYEITFRAGWGGCGDAMKAIAGFPMDDVAWAHDGGEHSVTFDCTFPVLKKIQLAIKGSPVSDLRCHRMIREK